jgi:copper chaperone CopZ
VRGALLKLPGVAKVDVAVGKQEFTVDYDDRKVKAEEFVPVLKKAGHPAKLRAG